MASVYKMLQLPCVFILFLTCVLAKPKSNLILLNEETWPDMLEGEWLIKFYAPWCPACRAMIPVWDGVAGWSEDLDIKVAKIDVTDNPGLSGRFLVTSLPTVYHVNDGEFRVYRGARSENDIISFVDDEKWREVEPVPWYTSPTAVHMSALGMFFKASMSIRDLHDKMTTDYGIPVWGSYMIFAVATIIFGLILGLLLVFLCDCMLPNVPPPHPSYISTRPQYTDIRPSPINEEDKESDIITDDLPPIRTKSQTTETTQQPDTRTAPPPGGSTVEGAAAAADDNDSSEEEDSQVEGSQEELSQEEESGSQGEEPVDDLPESIPEGDEASGGDIKRPKSARRRKPRATTD